MLKYRNSQLYADSITFVEMMVLCRSDLVDQCKQMPLQQHSGRVSI